MMKRPLLAMALPLAFLAIPALSCEYPDRIKLPDGKTANQESMLEGQKAVQGYIAAMEEYLECIDKDSETVPTDDKQAEKEQRAILVGKHNAAVDEMEKVADSFNEQVRKYKAAN